MVNNFAEETQRTHARMRRQAPLCVTLFDSQALSDVTLPTVFQGLNAQLLSVLQEKSTLVNDLIALQDNFLQEQSLTTVLIFLPHTCVLH